MCDRHPWTLRCEHPRRRHAEAGHEIWPEKQWQVLLPRVPAPLRAQHEAEGGDPLSEEEATALSHSCKYGVRLSAVQHIYVASITVLSFIYIAETEALYIMHGNTAHSVTSEIQCTCIFPKMIKFVFWRKSILCRTIHYCNIFWRTQERLLVITGFLNVVQSFTCAALVSHTTWGWGLNVLCVTKAIATS